MSKRIDEAYRKIEQEAEKLNTPVTNMMANQIKGLIKTDKNAECVLRQDKTLKQLKDEFDTFARNHKKGNESVIGPEDSEHLIREYYGMRKETTHGCDVIDIMDYL